MYRMELRIREKERKKERKSERKGKKRVRYIHIERERGKLKEIE